jgi:probable DNA repair protein
VRAVCHDATDELTRAAVWARHKLEAQPGARVGIVVPGLAPVAAMAERIFDDILHPSFAFSARELHGSPSAFHVSGGESLAGTPIISAALLILRLVDGVPREEAALIWRSPFLGMDVEEATRLDVELRRQRVEFVSLRVASVQRRFPELAAAAATLPTRTRPSRWSATFSRLLHLAGWPGRRSLTPVEVQTLESWKDLLSELARLDTVFDSISRDDAVSRLARMAAASRSAMNGESAPVQIVDLSEAAGSRFDALWIAGLHAGAWPRRAQPNPFLPLALQRMAGMPGCSADREFAYAKRVTENLFASAPEVVCSFPAYASDEEQQASPFLAGFPLLPELPPADAVVRRVFAQAPRLEPRPVEDLVALPAGTLQRGGTRVLADQSACPFRAFAIHRLCAREMDEPDVGLSALDRGSLVHRALELLWKQLRTKDRLTALSQEEVESLIESCVESALAQYVDKQEPSRALDEFRKLEQARLEILIRKWLDVERERPTFEVVHSENARTVSVAGLSLDIRVDRIDRYEDGTHAIIDYKTSKTLSTDMWSGERPEAPQLPLYATTSGVIASEVAFAQLSTYAVQWLGKKGQELQEELPRWEAVVRRLAEDFLNGHAEVDPRDNPSPCDLCALHALCRVREMRLPRQGSDRDE